VRGAVSVVRYEWWMFLGMVLRNCLNVRASGVGCATAQYSGNDAVVVN